MPRASNGVQGFHGALARYSYKYALETLETNTSLNEGGNFSYKRKSAMLNKMINQQAKYWNTLSERIQRRVLGHNPQTKISYLFSIAMNPHYPF